MIKERIERIILDNIGSLNPITPEFGNDNLFECIEELQDYFIEQWAEDLKKEVKEEPFSSELEVVSYYEKKWKE